MSKLFGPYRILALIVGVLLTFLSLVVLPMKYLLSDGSDLQRLGEDLSVLWVVHGWFYMAYFVVAFLLARRARWTIQFTLLMLAAGLIPILIFWVERQVAHKVTAQLAEAPTTA